MTLDKNKQGERTKMTKETVLKRIAKAVRTHKLIKHESEQVKEYIIKATYQQYEVISIQDDADDYTPTENLNYVLCYTLEDDQEYVKSLIAEAKEELAKKA